MRSIVLAAALAGAAAPGASVAQAIVSDGRMPTPTSVTNIGNDYSIGGGTIRGSNLFHSFSAFSVPTGGSATFTLDQPAPIANVLGRVTGNEASSIDGLISTRGAMPSANFYLINPNGVMFGPNAALDVGGAVHVSTADYIKLQDGTTFAAAAPAGEVLSSAPPQAFGFLNSNPAAITIDGSQLFVDPAQTLSLIGGNVQLANGAVLGAPGGVVQIASVASSGEVVLGAPDLNTGSFSRLGEVTVSGGGIVASGDFGLPGGTVYIRAGRLVLDDGAILLSETYDMPGAGKGIDIGARESMTMRNGALAETVTYDAGQGSGISIAAGALNMTSGATIDALSLGPSTTGSIDIHAGGADIAGGAIRTTSNTSSAGDISLEASGTVTLAGSGTEIATGAGGGLVVIDPAIHAGNISISATDVVLRDGALLRSGSPTEQSGDSIGVAASNALSITSLAGILSTSTSRTGAAIDVSVGQLAMDAGFINTSTLSSFSGGRITVNAGNVRLTNGAQLATSSEVVAFGDAGSIDIHAGSISLSGLGPASGVGSVTFTGSQSSGLFSATAASGNAGQISVSTPMLAVTDGALISVRSSGSGSAGTIVANASILSINGGLIDSSTTGGGDGGAIFLNGSQVNIANGGRVTADSLGAGRTGNVTITASDSIVMSNGSISTRAATSDGGDITLTAPNIVRLEGSQISTSVESGTGSGGNVRIDPQFLIVNGSSITANAFGGPGGNITIIADNYLPSPTSIIEASSALSTPGSIQIASPENNVAGSIAQLPRALVDASRLMRSACSARREGTPSSFTLAGRGGVPPDPDGYLPSAIATAPVTPVALARMDSDDCAR